MISLFTFIIIINYHYISTYAFVSYSTSLPILHHITLMGLLSVDSYANKFMERAELITDALK